MTDGCNWDESSGSNGTAYFEGVPDLIESGGGTSDGGGVTETSGDGCLDLCGGVGVSAGWDDTCIG